MLREDQVHSLFALKIAFLRVKRFSSVKPFNTCVADQNTINSPVLTRVIYHKKH